MADDIPQWARERACELMDEYAPNHAWAARYNAPVRVIESFARYISQHEQPPVDPLLIEARGIVKATLTPKNHTGCSCREDIDAGKWDNGQKVRASLAALKRGMELALSPAASDVEQPSASSSAAFEARGRQGGSS